MDRRIRRNLSQKPSLEFDAAFFESDLVTLGIIPQKVHVGDLWSYDEDTKNYTCNLCKIRNIFKNVETLKKHFGSVQHGLYKQVNHLLEMNGKLKAENVRLRTLLKQTSSFKNKVFKDQGKTDSLID